MSTMAEYRTELGLLGYDGLDDTTLDLAIEQARRRVLQDKRWSFLATTNLGYSTTAGDDSVTLTSLSRIEAVRLADGDRRVPVEAREYQEVRDLQDLYPLDGEPEMWARFGDDLFFYPTPTAVYSLEIECIEDPGELGEGETDIIPDERRDLVVWAAVVPLAFRQREPQAASMADAHYTQTLLPKHFAEDARTQRQTSRQVRSGYWGTTWR